MKSYNKANVPLARELRKGMTRQEKRLWYRFLRGYPVRFQRQKPILNYIADFYCAEAKLVIELDGGGHYTDEQAAKDASRTADLEGMGIMVWRVCNADVDRNLRGVCDYIEYLVRERTRDRRSLEE